MGQLGGLSPQSSVAVGILVGLLSTSVQSIGLTLQRKSHILEDEKDPLDVRRPPFRRRRWQLGMLMFVVANLLGSTIQITTLPLPVLSTLQASGLVFNSICASLILGEPFTRWSLGGTILVCAGAVLIAIFGAIGEPAHNLDQLLALLGRRQFVIWMIGQAILVVAIIIGTRTLKFLNPRTNNSPMMRLFRGMAYGCISGILSAHSLLVAKSAVELLVRTIVDRVNQFNRWQSWVSLLGLLALALSQLFYLHKGLKLCSTSILYPFVFCVYNIIAILDGLIYFNQSSRLSLGHALLIALGTIILLSGVLALSWRLSDESTTKTQVPQTPLTPGMGFAPESPSPSSSTSPSQLNSNDEESLISGPSSLLSPDRHDYSAKDSENGDENHLYKPLTPTSRSNAILDSTRRLRKTSTFRRPPANEIWNELTEDALNTSSRRRSVRFSPQPRRVSARSHPSPSASGTNASSDSQAIDPDESTALLPLARSGTGRAYRDTRHLRRVSGPGSMGSTPRRSTSGSLSRDESNKRDHGWSWISKWWNRNQ